MNWYKGGIAEAIATSKSRGAIFVVYIEGKDEKSTEFTQLIDNAEVSGKLGGANFVAIKIEAGTVPHQQFTQIFKETPVPSIYFIGKQGSPLEIVTEAKDVPSLCLKLDSVVQKAGLVTSPTQEAAGQSQNFINSERSTIPANVECENGVCTIKKEDPSTSQDQNGTETTEVEKKAELTADEKVERAKQLVERQRLEKEKEEEEKQRLKEIERRKMGQNVQQLKRWQDEQEMKNLLEEREREKRESQMARQRVLDQIAQDKAERAARFSGAAAPSQPQSSSSPQNVTHRPVNSNLARLQFRMPDGRIATQDFSSQDTLEVVHTHVRNNLQLPFNQYTLSTTFPRREFGQNDRSQTLADLELVPTAVILVLPVNRGAVSTNPGGGFTGMLWSVLTPILNVLGYLRNFIFGAPFNPPNNTDSSANKTDSSNEASRMQPKRRPGETTVVRKQGNVHRLSNKSDSDDDNNTWNGNSTQQM